MCCVSRTQCARRGMGKSSGKKKSGREEAAAASAEGRLLYLRRACLLPSRRVRCVYSDRLQRDAARNSGPAQRRNSRKVGPRPDERVDTGASGGPPLEAGESEQEKEEDGDEEDATKTSSPM